MSGTESDEFPSPRQGRDFDARLPDQRPTRPGVELIERVDAFGAPLLPLQSDAE